MAVSRFTPTLIGLLIAAGVWAAPAGAQNAIVTDNPALCGSVSPSGARVAACSTTLNQYRRTYEPRNAFVFRTSTGLCLDGSRGKGQQLFLGTCNNGKGQDWWINSNGRIQNQANNLCMDVSGGSIYAGAAIIMWDCHLGNNQNFAIGPVLTSAQVSALGLQYINGVWSVVGAGYNRSGVIAVGGGNVIAVGGGNFVGSASAP
jgi:hypothetical protein